MLRWAEQLICLNAEGFGDFIHDVYANRCLTVLYPLDTCRPDFRVTSQRVEVFSAVFGFHMS